MNLINNGEIINHWNNSVTKKTNAYTRKQGQWNSDRQNIEWWLPRAGWRGAWGAVDVYRLQFCKVKSVLYGCWITVWMYCTTTVYLKMVKMVNFMLHLFYSFKKQQIINRWPAMNTHKQGRSTSHTMTISFLVWKYVLTLHFQHYVSMFHALSMLVTTKKCLQMLLNVGQWESKITPKTYCFRITHCTLV